MFSSNTSQVSNAANYIEDVFSTWLYTGNGSTQTITNGIDLSTKGGLVWVKRRSAAGNNILADTNRGASAWLSSNLTNGQGSDSTKINSFTSSGFVVGSDSTTGSANNNYASWTFRKQPKFFDVVTYTGNGATGRQISHNLGSAPGMVIVKCTNGGTNWNIWHRGSPTGYFFFTTDAVQTGYAGLHFGTGTGPSDPAVAPTSTYFTVGSDGDVNASGGTYVAYLFAHNAGGFGLTGTDNVISCGSFTAPASSANQANVNLGWEPQWVLVKRVDSSAEGYWILIDNMRGVNGNNSNVLFPNNSNAEQFGLPQGQIAFGRPSSTGFYFNTGGLSGTPQYIYIAIRRGPMKTPTTGTSVYNAIARTGTGANATITGVGFPPDLVIAKRRNAGDSTPWVDRLRGRQTVIRSDSTGAEFTGTGAAIWDLLQDGFSVGTSSESNGSGSTYVNWAMRRAPGFFDVVCWTGTTSEGTPITVSHNLGAVPELIITKKRSQAAGWFTYHAALTAANYVSLDSSNASAAYSNMWNNTTPTSTVFTTAYQNASGDTYVAYLFASCPGVSKVGSYTGNGSSQTINCGFTGGARFVLIKRTNASGDWVVFDSARGIVSGNDPFLELNTLDAEDTGQDAVDTDSTGFVVNETSRSLNASGGTYIFLAIA